MCRVCVLPKKELMTFTVSVATKACEEIYFMTTRCWWWLEVRFYWENAVEGMFRNSFQFSMLMQIYDLVNKLSVKLVNSKFAHWELSRTLWSENERIQDDKRQKYSFLCNDKMTTTKKLLNFMSSGSFWVFCRFHKNSLDLLWTFWVETMANNSIILGLGS